MLTITVQVDAPAGAAQTAKEVLAMAMEAVGIVQVVGVQEDEPEQLSIEVRPKEEATPAQPGGGVVGKRAIYLETMLGLYKSGALIDEKQEAAYRAELEGIKGRR